MAFRMVADMSTCRHRPQYAGTRWLPSCLLIVFLHTCQGVERKGGVIDGRPQQAHPLEAGHS